MHVEVFENVFLASSIASRILEDVIVPRHARLEFDNLIAVDRVENLVCHLICSVSIQTLYASNARMSTGILGPQPEK